MAWILRGANDVPTDLTIHYVIIYVWSFYDGIVIARCKRDALRARFLIVRRTALPSYNAKRREVSKAKRETVRR